MFQEKGYPLVISQMWKFLTQGRLLNAWYENVIPWIWQIKFRRQAKLGYMNWEHKTYLGVILFYVPTKESLYQYYLANNCTYIYFYLHFSKRERPFLFLLNVVHVFLSTFLPSWIVIQLVKEPLLSQALAAHTCNPNYLGRRDQES
jgi:hypothetical protein